jgi:hypothetical protein
MSRKRFYLPPEMTKTMASGCTTGEQIDPIPTRKKAVA